MADGYLDLPGGSGNVADTPDHADFDIVGDIDIQVELLLNDWTPGAANCAWSKYNTTGNQASWSLNVATSGALTLLHTANGSTGVTATSTAATGFTDGTIHWIRATMDVDDGAGGRDIKFYTSPSGAVPSWTQLGTTVHVASTTSIHSGTALPAFGARNAGTFAIATGKVYRAKLYNGYDGAGTLKASPDFTAFSGGGATYTDPEGHVWTERGTANFVAATGATVTGTAVGSFTFTGTASGTPTVTATAAGSFTFTATAAGTPTVVGTAAGSYTFTGTASGVPAVQATAQGAYTFSGTATGTVTSPNVITGAAVGSYTFTGTAVGKRSVLATAVGAYTFSGTAQGSAAKFGTAVGNYVFTGTAHGHVVGVPVNVRFHVAVKSTSMALRASSTSMQLRARTTTMRLAVKGDRIEVRP